MVAKGMPPEELAFKIRHFLEVVIKKIDDEKKAGYIKLIQNMYLRFRINNWESSENGIRFNPTYEYISKLEWYWRDRMNFFDEHVKSLEGYRDLISRLITKYSITESQASTWLGRFVEGLLPKLQNQVSNDYLLNSANTFLIDVENYIEILSGKIERHPIKRDFKLWVKGFTLEWDELYIDDTIIIRKPKPTDFEYERLMEFFPVPHQDILGHIPDAIIEFTTIKRMDNYQAEIDLIINILRLFRIGTIYITRQEERFNSVLGDQGTFYPFHPSFIGSANYKIKGEDLQAIKAFFGIMKPLIEKTTIDEPIGIALERYIDALISPQNVRKIAFSTICLEALYLLNEKEELGFKLSQRISLLFRFLGDNPLEISNLFNKRLYKIRSDFVHGNVDTKEIKKWDVPHLAEQVLKYARSSIIIFLQFDIHNIVAKQKLIKMIDDAMIDESAQIQIEDLVKQKIHLW